ncbi:hypothetical protein IHV10_11140 [Fictibacillus sp. 5RED26]|uniref:hypothetical protein n=1 Tax=Fictibacillus sp. 5RED26 TaxID=2745876 RepID=UPI0018CF2A27|nr:hypothetical protein [Fictibacillus sp. 5RED26]MBH0156923.1 hypothetical protein [Fictibacillus sp. 5RED26]
MDLEEFKKYLEIGHDIEYKFYNEEYSITHTETGICLTKFYNLDHQEYENLDEFINKAKINNYKFIDILNQIYGMFIY